MGRGEGADILPIPANILFKSWIFLSVSVPELSSALDQSETLYKRVVKPLGDQGQGKRGEGGMWVMPPPLGKASEGAVGSSKPQLLDPQPHA